MHPYTVAKIVCNTIADNQLNVNNLADSLGVSSRWLQIFFLEKYGMSPRQFLESVRLKRALLLLADGMAIPEVCAGAGYYCAKTLTHACQRRLGKTPASLRRELHASGSTELFRSIDAQLFTERAISFVQKCVLSGEWE